MFRHSRLPCACFGVALGLAASIPMAPARAQDRMTLERLDRLERDLNMLQRQVYRGGPPPMPGSADPGVAMNAELRMDRIESQMRDLTGRVEEIMNQVERLQRVEQGGDADARLSQAPPGASGFAAATPPPPPPLGPPRPHGPGLPSREPPGDMGGIAFTPPGGPQSASLTPPGPLPPLGAPSQIAGTLTPPGVPAGPPDIASAAPPSTARPLPSGSTSEQYNHAFGLLKQADYPAAEVALKAFVEQHPNDTMAGNAQYWLGETYYTRGRYADAATAFAEGYKRYPKSSKAADELLKLGMSLARANQKQNACIALVQLDHDFPTPGAAIKERAAAEKKRLGC
ncbi:MAG: tol-pal system protein YbgF [Alphaproteobacteria bacterium]|nr:tol-pal system protein YbgF [Alphaproteobacteria bacterium]